MKRRGRMLFCSVAVVLVLCFIWGNSLLPGQESGRLSSGLLKWLGEHLPFLADMPELLLRKLGHFAEFAALGFFLCWLLRLGGQRGSYQVTAPMFFGLLAASIDETIQLFRPGRTASVVDVWIDFGGMCTGIGCFFLLRSIRAMTCRKGNGK